jgi:pimeloyl-ACP methyl ester carboxylesterase
MRRFLISIACSASVTAAVSFLDFASCVFAQERTAALKNGMIIGPGLAVSISQVDDNAFSSIQTETITAKRILVIDDDLRRTYMNQILLQGPMSDRGVPLQRIETGNAIPSLRASGSHPRVAGVQRALSVTPFDAFGRRVYTLATPKGPVEVLQGITEISAAFVRVESLNAEKTYLWDMRLALNAIPPDRLREILINNASQTDPQSWLDIVALYSDAKRYIEAREFLVESIQRFPELENQRVQIKQFDQLLAEQMFDEVRLRSQAGQLKLAEALLRSFPVDRLSIETKIKIERRLSEITADQAKVTSTLALIRADADKIPDAEIKTQLVPILEEIQKRLSPTTLNRLSDYLRLRDDATLTNEQRIAIAISGWLMGSGQSENNLPVALSAWQARDMIREYLSTATEAQRDSLIDRMKKMEGGTPRFATKIIAQMNPPLPLPESASDIQGRFIVEVPHSADAEGTPIKYSIQLPPEYDPSRRYPCIVSLHSQFAGPKEVLEWWSGPYLPEPEMCIGEASRYGYIVIAPHWAKPKQPNYNYTEDEHARVLRSLRDAMRRTSIDVDRVFLCGHHMGGDAAWDMALAHPDIWAGMIGIGAECEKYAIHYSENARYVPLYFIYGALDGGGIGSVMARNGKRLDEFLTSQKFDCLLTIYHGRGRDHFQEEQPRLIEWMNLSSHRRPPPPQEIDVSTARACDRQFWWLEIPELTGENIVNPLLFKPGKAELIANKVNGPDNGFRISKFPGKNCTIWLSPETIDFSKKVIFSVKDKRKTFEVQPNLKVLMEDVRTRADRQHPYWERVEF